MPTHPNDKSAQIRQMRRNIRKLQQHQKNPAVMDALARSALEVARARMDELEQCESQLSALVNSLDERCAELEQENAAQQAKIDALMLEWCPDEVSPEQFNNWARHQVHHTPSESERADTNRKLLALPTVPTGAS